jgi:O-antigen ligase
VIGLVWHSLPAQATDYATDVSLQSYNMQTRLVAMDHILNAYHQDPLFGAGVGLRKWVEPHNMFVLCLGETGLLGTAAFTIAFGAGFYTFFLALRVSKNDPLARRITIAGAAVFLLTTIDGMTDIYWRRGVSILGWVGVGMAVNVLRQVRARSLRVSRPVNRRKALPGREVVV